MHHCTYIHQCVRSGVWSQECILIQLSIHANTCTQKSISMNCSVLSPPSPICTRAGRACTCSTLSTPPPPLAPLIPLLFCIPTSLGLAGGTPAASLPSPYSAYTTHHLLTFVSPTCVQGYCRQTHTHACIHTHTHTHTHTATPRTPIYVGPFRSNCVCVLASCQ